MTFGIGQYQAALSRRTMMMTAVMACTAATRVKSTARPDGTDSEQPQASMTQTTTSDAKFDCPPMLHTELPRLNNTPRWVGPATFSAKPAGSKRA